MKGATAEPWASTITPPNSTTTSTTGMSQYFLRTLRNRQNSIKNDINAPPALPVSRIRLESRREARPEEGPMTPEGRRAKVPSIPEGTLLHHISLPVSDLEASKRFYDAALGALGYRCVYADETFVGYGVEDGEDKLALKLSAPAMAAGEGFHLALAAPSRAAVDAFHAAAIAQGATDNGAPGPRAHYGPSYYACFVIDPDGHRLEAVINDVG